MLTIYLSHPFTGNESENREKARAYAAEITRKRSDILIVNPLDAMMYAWFLPYVDVLEKTIALMMMCDAAVALGDWQISTGCMAEYNVARQNGMKWMESVEEVVNYHPKRRKR